jgi:peptidoglycan/LPS O-acetylase OafA/YrhL
VDGDGRKTHPVLLGGRWAGVIRLRGWERYGWMAFAVAGLVTGGLSLAQLPGASIRKRDFDGAETITSAAAVAAVVGFVLAMRRYDGETKEAPPSRTKRLASRFVRSE